MGKLFLKLCEIGQGILKNYQYQFLGILLSDSDTSRVLECKMPPHLLPSEWFFLHKYTLTVLKQQRISHQTTNRTGCSCWCCGPITCCLKLKNACGHWLQTKPYHLGTNRINAGIVWLEKFGCYLALGYCGILLKGIEFPARMWNSHQWAQHQAFKRTFVLYSGSGHHDITLWCHCRCVRAQSDPSLAFKSGAHFAQFIIQTGRRQETEGFRQCFWVIYYLFLPLYMHIYIYCSG